MNPNASKVVTAALLGIDSVTIVIAGRRFIIKPPTIHRIAGAAYYLSDIGGGNSISDILRTINDSYKLAEALSFFIAGDTSLSAELANGTLDELIEGISKAYSLISAENFMKLSALARSVAILTAKPK